MILYLNGDSHSYGINLEDHCKFGNIVAEKFSMNLINQSKIGASNNYIVRTTKEYLKSNSPELIIIGWSSWEREEWFYQDQYFNVNSSGHDVLPPELETEYKNWVTTQTNETLNKKSQIWHDTIYEFHRELKKEKIAHVFFNCMYDFFAVTNRSDWNHNHVGPYDNNQSFYWHLKNQGFTSDQWYHYGADANLSWASFLINHIQKHDIIR